MHYHVSSDELTPGTILEPKYGLKIKDPAFYRQSDYCHAQYLKEMIFEDIRRANHPSRPSRLNSVYLIEKLEDAKKYKEINGGKHIYEVTLLESSNILIGDMKWLDLSN